MGKVGRSSYLVLEGIFSLKFEIVEEIFVQTRIKRNWIYNSLVDYCKGIVRGRCPLKCIECERQDLRTYIAGIDVL